MHTLRIVGGPDTNGTKVELDGKELLCTEVELISIKGQVGNFWTAVLTLPTVKFEGDLTSDVYESPTGLDEPTEGA